MITKQKLEIYKLYGGDVDSLGRGMKASHQKTINGNDFYIIGSLIQNITIIRNKLASKEFEKETEKKLLENCDTIETITEIKAMTGF